MIQVTLIAAITLIVVPLPAIQQQFGLSPAELALLSAGYGLSFGGLLLVGGRLTDRFGARRMFVAGLAVFGGTSLLGGLAAAHVVVLAARFTQGVGAAMVAPAAVALVTHLYPDSARRSRAFAVWGTLSITGAVAGTMLSGLIASVGSWRWTFLIPAVIATGVLAGFRRLPAASAQPASQLGVLDGTLVTAGLVALSYGVLEGRLVVIGSSVLVLVGFLVRQVHAADPLLPIQLLMDRGRGAALLVIWLTAAASTVGTFLLSLYFQQIQGRSSAMTSVAFLPFLLILTTAPLSAHLTRRHGVRRVTVLGLLLAATSMLLLSRIQVDSPYGGVVLAALALFPLGAGLAFSGATVTAMSRVPAERSGVAGGLVNTAMEVGPTVGLALLLALATARTEALRDDGLATAAATTGGYAAAFTVTALAFAITATAVAFTFRKEEQQ
ncbi:MFS transporter [Phytoactinopolyspora alkaliphila]|uniref:MFS transporter n=1 Tax=Phytoactinopolyspora alkaliphila TaxID=1783498 RepID=A0A6N9YJS3_9ACTN|nr:MFS transporter [Phytoactinopolyspora alkaliphila]